MSSADSCLEATIYPSTEDEVDEDVEEFRVFLIDEHFHCFSNKVVSRGTVNQTYAYPRDIVQIAEEQKAKYKSCP